MKGNDWLFFLDHIDGDDEIITGWFKGGRNIGLLPPVVDRDTLAERNNPKTPTEGEVYNTHFVLRLSDGLLIFEKTFHDVVTIHRISDFLDRVGNEEMRANNANTLLISPLISQDFLSTITNKFRTHTSLKVRIDILNGYTGQNEALAELQKAIESTRANYIELEFGIRRITGRPTPDMERESFLAFIRRQLADETSILSARVCGKNTHGKQDHVDLGKIEEKWPFKAPLDERGLVVSNVLLDFMVQVARKRDRLF